MKSLPLQPNQSSALGAEIGRQAVSQGAPAPKTVHYGATHSVLDCGP